MFQLKNVGSAAIGASILAVGLSLALPAAAQWLPDRSYTEGPGLRVGDLELHPGVAVRGGYDSNIFLTGRPRVSSGILAVTPHLNIRTLGKQRLTQGETAAGSVNAPQGPIAFNLGASGTFFKYFSDKGPTNAEIDTDSTLSVLPARRVGFDVGIAYARQIRPFSAYGGFGRNNLYAVDRIRPVFNLRTQSRSGVLAASVAYAPSVAIFENVRYSFLNNSQHNVNAGASWKFLPYTALIYDGTLAFTKYQNADSDRATLLLSPESTSFRSRVGVNGAITNAIGARALVGYTAGRYSQKQLDDYEDVVGEAAINYTVGQSKFELGFIRDVQASALSGWMLINRGYTSIGTLLGRVVALNLTAGIGNANYGRLLAADGTPLGIDKKTGLGTEHRTDLRADGGLHAEFRVTNWLAFLADLNTYMAKTDFRYRVAAGAASPGQFVTYQAFGGVRAHY